jgi:hypothetical protein
MILIVHLSLKLILFQNIYIKNSIENNNPQFNNKKRKFLLKKTNWIFLKANLNLKNY